MMMIRPPDITTSQLLTMRDEPIHQDLVLENVSSIPNMLNQNPSHPISNRAFAGFLKHPLVTPTTQQSVKMLPP